MYNHIISLGDELWYIIEDGIDILVDGVGMVSDRKTLTPAPKKIHIEHHRVRDILVNALPHSEYIKIIDKSTVKTIFKSLCATYEGNQQVQEVKVNLLVQQYELFRMKEDEDIETTFSIFQVLVSGLQVLNKGYTTSDHVKKILRSLPVRYKPKVTAIQEAKDLNTLNLESLITAKVSQVWESEEAYHVEGSKDDSDDEEITFITKRFQYLAKKNKRLFGRSSGFKGFSSREKKDDHKGCFNCKKPSNFIAKCPELQNEKSKKGNFQKDSFRNKFKKSLMVMWDGLHNEEDSEKDEEKVNIVLMALTSSDTESDSDYGSESEEEDEVFYKLSRSDFITFIQDHMRRCQEKSRHMKILKMQYYILREELNYVQRKNEAIEKDHSALVK
ncbi:uncharacterized protein LOC127104796 [Lathyrus oleraceus]|uniref:uncharacterized protein LOC127104796 n=1 Tax=Pisum sativum TaxID=3888 RepID=UPI0021D12B1E|nr:uncharacterized protein LOC127104796 [Pisum sativum]